MENIYSIEFLILFISAVVFILYGYSAKTLNQKPEEGNLGVFKIAAGLSMSFVGGAATIAMSGIGYSNGWIALVDPISVVLGGFLVILIISHFSTPNNMEGTSSYLARGNQETTVVYSICGIFVYTLLASAQIVALKKIFLPYVGETWSLIFSIFFFIGIIGYIYRAGIQAVTKTDVLQFILVLLLFVLPSIYGIKIIITDITPSSPIEQSQLSLRTILLLSYSLLFVPLSQDVWYRVRRAKNDNTAKLGIIGGVIIYSLLVSLAISLGVFSATVGIEVPDPESVLTFLFASKFGFAGYVTAVMILAAIMSTLDSFCYNLISTISEDFLGNVTTSISAQKRRLVAASLVFTFCIVIVAFSDSVLNLVLTALMIYVSVIGPGIVHNKIFNGSRANLWIPALITLALILVSGLLKFQFPYEPYIYFFIHLLMIQILKVFTKFYIK